MIRANCVNRFTTVCTGHCDTCINGNTFGQSAVEQTELLQETFNKGYALGRLETATKFSNKVDEIVDWCITSENGEDFDYEYLINCLRNLKKEFGVEVEE